jgi:hypothetical protein
MATESSGKDVEKATSMNPIFVFPKPVMLAMLIELLIAKLLDLIKTANDASRIAIFPIDPSCSNTSCFSPFFSKYGIEIINIDSLD